MVRCLRSFFLCWLSCSCGAGVALAGDWPMWRHDAGRTAETPEKLGSELHLQWTWQYPPVKPAFPPTCGPNKSLEKTLNAVGGVEQELPGRNLNGKLGEFDKGYEPIVLDNTMYLGSSASDRLTAIDITTGEEKWRYYVNGPIRYAPIAYQDLVIFGSDDGYVYCLKASTAEVAWKFHAAPTGRQHLGNQRLISAWPVRGGPVLHEGKVYLGAGNWPFEGTFYYCLDAATGRAIWENSTSGSFFRFMNWEPDRSSRRPGPAGILRDRRRQPRHAVRQGQARPLGQAYRAAYRRSEGELHATDARSREWQVGPGQVRLDQGKNRRDHGRRQEVQRIPGRPRQRAQPAGRAGAIVCRDERGEHLLLRAAATGKSEDVQGQECAPAKRRRQMESIRRRDAFQDQRAHRLLPGAGSRDRATGRGVGLAEPIQDRGGRSGPCQGGDAAAQVRRRGRLWRTN